MNSESTEYDEFIKKGIIHVNQFGIKEIKEFQDFWSGYFDENKLNEINELIKAGDISAIKLLPGVGNVESGFLDLVKFKDQSDQEYIATIYESLDLWRNPEIIEIFQL